MYRERQSDVTDIKEFNNLKYLDISTLFWKLIEHEHELKILEASEANVKKKEKIKKENKNISLKFSTSNAKVEDIKDNAHEESSKE